MKPLDAAIKRETRGETVRWQAEPKLRRSLGSRLLGLLGSGRIPLARPVYVLTDHRLLAFELRGEEVHLREVPAGRTRDLLSRWTSLTEAERASAEARLLKEIELLCPTETVNTLKRTVERTPR